jgi:hypothetical protein
MNFQKDGPPVFVSSSEIFVKICVLILASEHLMKGDKAHMVLRHKTHSLTSTYILSFLYQIIR